MIGVESGWEIYVAGNGGIKTEVAQFLVKVKTADEVLEYAGAFLELYREEGWYLERTVHYVSRVGLDHVKKRVARRRRGPSRALGAAAVRARRRARSLARDGKARIDLRQFAAMPGMSEASGGSRARCAGATRSWVDVVAVCALDDIPSRGARVVERAGHPDGKSPCSAPPTIACSRSLDRCPHKGGPLSQGIVFGDRVACPLHNWTIELADGRGGSAGRSGCARDD